MSKQTSSYIKSAAAGLVAGSAAFLAVRTFSASRKTLRKTAAKLIGDIMDNVF